MTFKKFEELLKTKYPEAGACMHSKFAGTEHNKKVEIHFTPEGKCYEYYGAYEDILNRLGMKVISKSRLASEESALRRYKEMQGKPDPFFGIFNSDDNGVLDYSKEITEYEERIARLKRDYIIV